MPQQEYSALMKLQKRQLPDPQGRDGLIIVGNYPQLDLRFNQVEYKTSKHGVAHGLCVDSNGKTPKSEAISLRNSLLDMPNRPNIKQFSNGQYQGGTPKSCDSINLFDLDTNLIAVYKKFPDGSYLFLTTCKLNQIERQNLIVTDGNFMTEKVLNNLKAVSTNVINNKYNNITDTNNTN